MPPFGLWFPIETADFGDRGLFYLVDADTPTREVTYVGLYRSWRTRGTPLWWMPDPVFESTFHPE